MVKREEAIGKPLLSFADKKDEKQTNKDSFVPVSTSMVGTFVIIASTVVLFWLMVWFAGQHGNDLEQTEQLFNKAAISVTENQPGFPSFWNFDHTHPIRVTYDNRAILLNGERSLFLSGSIHPVRVTQSGWNQALDDAVHQGLNMITMYLFWSYHQPFPDQPIDWSLPGDNGNNNWTIASAVREAANRGMFLHIRIGPYCDAEYNYGGIPEWLPLKYPDMQMRRLDQDWMAAMEGFVNETTLYLRSHKLWAYQGGPILLAQIENELGDSDADGNNSNDDIQVYADWCGAMASKYEPQVIWTMCMGVTAKNAINTCNGFGEKGGCSTTFLEQNGQTGRILVDQPALWTENEGGFQTWGEDPLHPTDYFWGRPANEVARDTLKWFARGGSHNNYYMWWGK